MSANVLIPTALRHNWVLKFGHSILHPQMYAEIRRFCIFVQIYLYIHTGLLDLIALTRNDDLCTAMNTFITDFMEDVIPVAVEIASHLVCFCLSVCLCFSMFRPVGFQEKKN